MRRKDLLHEVIHARFEESRYAGWMHAHQLMRIHKAVPRKTWQPQRRNGKNLMSGVGIHWISCNGVQLRTLYTRSFAYAVHRLMAALICAIGLVSNCEHNELTRA